MIDVSTVVNSTEFAQPFNILRSTGSWQFGVFQSAQTTVAGFGVISVAQPSDLDMQPQGDIVKGAMVFHATQPIFKTWANDTGGESATSDILIWRGEQWRVLSVSRYQDFGYWKAIATRMNAA